VVTVAPAVPSIPRLGDTLFDSRCPLRPLLAHALTILLGSITWALGSSSTRATQCTGIRSSGRPRTVGHLRRAACSTEGRGTRRTGHVQPAAICTRDSCRPGRPRAPLAAVASSGDRGGCRRTHHPRGSRQGQRDAAARCTRLLRSSCRAPQLLGSVAGSTQARRQRERRAARTLRRRELAAAAARAGGPQLAGSVRPPAARVAGGARTSRYQLAGPAGAIAAPAAERVARDRRSERRTRRAGARCGPVHGQRATIRAVHRPARAQAVRVRGDRRASGRRARRATRAGEHGARRQRGHDGSPKREPCLPSARVGVLAVGWASHRRAGWSRAQARCGVDADHAIEGSSRLSRNTSTKRTEVEGRQPRLPPAISATGMPHRASTVMGSSDHLDRVLPVSQPQRGAEPRAGAGSAARCRNRGCGALEHQLARLAAISNASPTSRVSTPAIVGRVPAPRPRRGAAASPRARRLDVSRGARRPGPSRRSSTIDASSAAVATDRRAATRRGTPAPAMWATGVCALQVGSCLSAVLREERCVAGTAITLDADGVRGQIVAAGECLPPHAGQGHMLQPAGTVKSRQLPPTQIWSTLQVSPQPPQFWGRCRVHTRRCTSPCRAGIARTSAEQTRCRRRRCRRRATGVRVGRGVGQPPPSRPAEACTRRWRRRSTRCRCRCCRPAAVLRITW
jgi:hypothetical protein